MNNYQHFLYKNFNPIFLLFGALVITSVISVQLFLLNRTLIVSDEGWYLCLLRDVSDYGSSRFPFLFRNCFQGNIFGARFFVWIFTQIACLVFALGIGSFAHNLYPHKDKWLLFGITIISVYVGCMYIEPCPSPNYITLNKIAAGLGLGLLLLAISKNWRSCYVVSGFFISFLFPIMITNVILIIFMLITIILISNHKLRDTALFMGGIILFFIYYFICVETPASAYEFLSSRTDGTIALGSQGHGIIFLVNWLQDTLLYLIKMFTMSIFICVGYICISKWIKYGFRSITTQDFNSKSSLHFGA